MSSSRKARMAFRPSVVENLLEERVVLSTGTGAQVSTLASAAQTGSQATLTRRDLAQAYRTQLGAATADLKKYVDTQLGNLYASGTPTASQLATLQDQIDGAVAATAFRVSSQLALLPGATDRLVAQVQDNLLTDSNRGLAGRINRLISRLNGAPNRLLSSINRAIDSVGIRDTASTSNFLASAPLNRLSVDATSGQQIPLQQFMAQQVLSQFGNTLGSLAASFPNVANTAIFNNGVMSTDPAVQQAFATQLQSAVGLATSQLGGNLGVFPNNLSLFPGAGTDILTPLSKIFFGDLSTGTGSTSGTGSTTTVPGSGTIVGIGPGPTTGTTGTTGFTNLFGALAGVPTTSADFLPGVNTAFTNTFQNVGSTLGGFFGFPSSSINTALPTAPFSNMFSSNFSNLGNGFVNGFGSGFVGFGQPQNGSNDFLANSFGNGFGAITTAQNEFLGFNPSGSNFNGFGLTGTGTTTGTTGTTTGTTGTTTGTTGVSGSGI
jgi:hypothetical protein